MVQRLRILGKEADRRTRRSARQPGLVSPAGGARPSAAAFSPRREAPRLRRSFPPLEPEREALLRERNCVAFAEDPRRIELEHRLLELGGTFALLFLPDPQIGDLLERGQYFPAARALMCLGAAHNCHANAAMMLVTSKGDVRIASGYALSDDGLWRQHSWGIDAHDGHILETTERRLRYFGYVMDDRESAMRLLTLMGSGHFWPEEVKEARQFLEGSYGPMPAALLENSS